MVLKTIEKALIAEEEGKSMKARSLVDDAIQEAEILLQKIIPKEASDLRAFIQLAEKVTSYLSQPKEQRFQSQAILKMLINDAKRINFDTIKDLAEERA